jgi:hypothetical protein
MTQNQVNFLLDNFFAHNLTGDYAGWRNIAESLIKTGEVITTKHAEDMWRGGVGNYIKTGAGPKGSVDCITMTFDVDELVSKDNKWFMETRQNFLIKAEDELHKAKRKYNELENLV